MIEFIYGFIVGFVPYTYSKGWLKLAYDKIKPIVASWFKSKDVSK